MKDVLKAMCVISVILSFCAAAVVVLSRSGLGKRQYLTVEEN